MKNATLFPALIASVALSLAACGGESAQKTAESATTSASTNTQSAQPNPEQAKQELQPLFTWYEGTAKKLAEIQQEMAQKTQALQAANPNDAEMKSKMAVLVKEHSQKQISQLETFVKELDGMNVKQAESQELKALFQKSFQHQIDLLGLTIKMVDKPDPSMKAELDSKAQAALTDAQAVHEMMIKLQQKYAN